jgi:predicted amidohydrolase
MFTTPFGKIGLGICYDIVSYSLCHMIQADEVAIPRTRHDCRSTGYANDSSHQGA